MQGAPIDTPILEIGAGTGALTRALLRRGANLTALEIDSDLLAGLRSQPELGQARIVHADALTFDYASFARGTLWRVAGNLPYNIATPLVTRLCEMEGGPQTMTVMVQKDVAERFAAKAGTRAYGSLSVAVQYAMHVELAFTLEPRAFRPPPKVDSAVVRLVRRQTPAVIPHDLALFRKVVRAAFAYRRKTLRNSLSLALGYDDERIARALELSNLPSEQRGERLDLYEFVKLADALAEG
jgi:16S rRNA (adenine1518-N6/adenine1519-N6)-dimethyltransferase